MPAYLQTCMKEEEHRANALLIAASVMFYESVVCIAATFSGLPFPFVEAQNFESNCNAIRKKQEKYLSNLFCWEES